MAQKTRQLTRQPEYIAIHKTGGSAMELDHMVRFNRVMSLPLSLIIVMEEVSS